MNCNGWTWVAGAGLTRFAPATATPDPFNHRKNTHGAAACRFEVGNPRFWTPYPA